jgi:hypothetical protein
MQMIAVKEITVWKDGSTANHTYLLDGDKLVAYIRKDTTEPFYFKQPIKGFSRSYRKFEELKTNPFKDAEKKTKSTTIRVSGSKGSTYEVDTDAQTCTCPGFRFRGSCKHLEIKQ